MKRLVLLGLALSHLTLFAEEPQIVITFKNSANGYGTVAGRVVSSKGKPVGITVQNGGLKFSSISDLDGSWGLVFPHRAVNFTVTAWELGNHSEILAKTSESL